MPALMDEIDFLSRLQDLLAAEVDGVDKGRVLRQAAGALERRGRPVECRIVPFVPGRRPGAEAAHPGLGSSEAVAVILPGEEQDPAWVLYTLEGEAEVRARVSFAGAIPVPGWEDRPVPPTGALAIVPVLDLLPGAGWAW